jgi:hypothetical protein
MSTATPRPDIESEQRASEVRRRGLILLCVVVSLIGGYLGGGLEAVPSWDAIALAIAQLCVAALVAMGALRVVDLLALRRQSHVRLERCGLSPEQRGQISKLLGLMVRSDRVPWLVRPATQ